MGTCFPSKKSVLLPVFWKTLLNDRPAVFLHESSGGKDSIQHYRMSELEYFMVIFLLESKHFPYQHQNLKWTMKPKTVGLP